MQFIMQEWLLLVSPYGLMIHVFMYAGMMISRPQWEVFVTALLPASYLSSPWLVGALVLMETAVALFMEFNLIFLIFFELSLQTTHFAMVDHTINKMR